MSPCPARRTRIHRSSLALALCVAPVQLSANPATADAPSWKKVIADIADEKASPQYHGLSITGQRDLEPLQKDPTSGLWEFLVKETGTKPRVAEGKALEFEDTTGIVLVLLPAGSTQLGTTAPPGHSDESPPRTIELDAFFIAKCEITQGQWKRIAGNNPSEFSVGKLMGGHQITARYPVEQVTWDECRRHLGKFKLRLPTEAQWERACRAGTTTEWSFGDETIELSQYANVHDRSAAKENKKFEPAEWNDGFPFTAPAAQHRANPFGLYDMHGNVWEWCEDGYQGDAYRALVPRPKDGLQEIEKPAARSIRGGSYWAPLRDSRSAERTGIPPGTRARGVGVRPVRPVRPVE